MHEETRDLCAGLERKNKASGQIVLGILQLLNSNRLFDDPPDFIDEPFNGQFHVFGRRSNERDEAARIQSGSHGDTCKCRVGQPEIVTQPLRYARREAGTAT